MKGQKIIKLTLSLLVLFLVSITLAGCLVDLPELTKLATPSNFVIENQENTHLYFAWDEVENASSYKLYFYNEADQEVKTFTATSGDLMIFNELNLPSGNYTAKLQAVGDLRSYAHSDLTEASPAFTVPVVESTGPIEGDVKLTAKFVKLPAEEVSQVKVIRGSNLVRILMIDGVVRMATLSPGVVELEITNEEQTNSFVYTIVYQTSSFNRGSSLTSYNNNKQNYLSEEVTPYTVGNSNPYIIDISSTYATFDADNKVQSLESNLFNVDLEYSLKLDGIAVELSTYASVDISRGILFNEQALDKTFEINVKPANGASSGFSHQVLVKEGINVHSNLEMKTAFADLDVHDIYLHRNIVGELLDDQYYTLKGNRYPFNYYSMSVEETRQQHGNLYRRYHETSIGKLRVHGNYYAINASNVPLISPYDGTPTDDFGNPIDGQQGLVPHTDGVVGVQSSIFRFGVLNGEAGSNAVEFNNLSVIGNTNRPDPTNIAISGGLIGIKSENADISVINTNVAFTTVGLYPIYKISNLNVDYAKITNSWAGNMLLWGNGLSTITNSYIAHSGSASISVIDMYTAKGIENRDDPVVVIENTEIINIVTADSPWFVAYKLQTLGTLIDRIENDVIKSARDYATSNGIPFAKTIVYDPENNIEDSSFNFVILVQSDDGFSPDVAPQAHITIDGKEVYRQFTGGDSEVGTPYSMSNEVISMVTEAGAICTPYGWDIAGDLLQKYMEFMTDPAKKAYWDSLSNDARANLIMQLFGESIIVGALTTQTNYVELMPSPALTDGAKIIAIVEWYDKGLN